MLNIILNVSCISILYTFWRRFVFFMSCCTNKSIWISASKLMKNMWRNQGTIYALNYILFFFCPFRIYWNHTHNAHHLPQPAICDWLIDITLKHKSVSKLLYVCLVNILKQSMASLVPLLVQTPNCSLAASVFLLFSTLSFMILRFILNTLLIKL